MKPEERSRALTPLYRPEAMATARPQHIGRIVLIPSVSSRWVGVAALIMVVALSLLIALGSYTRRSTVTGQLYPNEGLIRITAAQPGVVVERHVSDGQVVKRGTVLFVLSGDRAGPDALAYQRGMALQMDARRRSLGDDILRLEQAEKIDDEKLRRRMDSLNAELVQVGRQTAQIELRVKSAEDTSLRYGELLQKGFVSRDEMLLKEGELNELRSRLEGSRREALVLGRDLATTQRELQGLPTRYATQRAELDRAILLVQQEFTELEARRQVVVAAPSDGQVTLVQADIGQSVDGSRPLAHLVPESAQLVARLYVPSRSSGFVRAGEPVLLRFDAFPYQRFGQFSGKVVSASMAAVSGANLPGFVQPPDLSNEPMFEVTVSLPEQAITNTGQRLPLQTGMRVEADLMHETRRLYEWILEPLYVARSRVTNS